MKRPLYITGAGAVTPAGLDVAQTLAAIRAGLSAVDAWMDGEGETVTVARVPARSRLRRTEAEWLVNLAARAVDEAIRSRPTSSEATAILLTPPEIFRGHPAYQDIHPHAFLSAVLRATGQQFHRASRAVDGGAAAGFGLIDSAIEILEKEGAEQVLLGGVDSLINDVDLRRLAKAGRLAGDSNAQGLVPGEAAVFVCLARQPDNTASVHVAIHGVGVAQESDSVLSERFSQGHAMLRALRTAVSGSAPSEPDINFVVSNGNGERYSGWEQLIVRQRFYRTRREMLPTAYPAMTVGEVGTASGALSLILAADSFLKNYAPGPQAVCEVASDAGLRAAAVIGKVSRRS